MNISLLGIDIAKDVFQLHGADRLGKKLFKKRFSRNELADYIIRHQCNEPSHLLGCQLIIACLVFKRSLLKLDGRITNEY